MPDIHANGLSMHYAQQGAGEPLLLIPYLAADHMCYAFQVQAYARHFTCYSLDLRGTGGSDKPAAAYTTEGLADDVAAFMAAAGIPRAHVSGLSLGGAVGLWLAAKYPERVASLSVQSCWAKTDPLLRAVVESWQLLAKVTRVHDVIVHGIFPWCFTPEFYAGKPEFLKSLVDFVYSRPESSADDFMRQSNAVLGHDVEPHLHRITAPTQIVFGQHDRLTSTRFARPMTQGIRQTELVVLDDCAHGLLYERVEEFNQQTLAFLQRHSGAAVV